MNLKIPCLFSTRRLLIRHTEDSHHVLVDHRPFSVMKAGIRFHCLWVKERAINLYNKEKYWDLWHLHYWRNKTKGLNDDSTLSPHFGQSCSHSLLFRSWRLAKGLRHLIFTIQPPSFIFLILMRGIGDLPIIISMSGVSAKGIRWNLPQRL